MRQTMVSTYPQLEGVRVETAWTGLMAYARHLMPLIGQLQPGIWYVFGFSGRMNTRRLSEMIAKGFSITGDRLAAMTRYTSCGGGGAWRCTAAQLHLLDVSGDGSRQGASGREGCVRYDCVSLPNRARGAWAFQETAIGPHAI